MSAYSSGRDALSDDVQGGVVVCPVVVFTTGKSGVVGKRFPEHVFVSTRKTAGSDSLKSVWFFLRPYPG